MKVAIDISPLKSAHQFRGVGGYTKRLIEALQLIKLPSFSFQLIKEGKIPDNVDIIHYPYFDLFWLTLPLKKPFPTVTTVHDLIPLVFPDKFPKGIKGGIKYQIQKQSLKGVKAIITDSENSKKDIIKFIGFPKERIYVVYLAPGREFGQLKIENLKLKIKQKYRLPDAFVLYVGDVNYSKNILGLVRACKKIKTPVVIVGKQAGEEDFDRSHIENKPLLQLIKVYGKDPGVIRLGFIPDKDLVAIYNLATVYCQPSFYEGFGLPVLEAMACGTPVVAANTSSLPEICGDAAIMVNPYKIENIAQGIKKVISDKIIRGRLVEKGSTQAKKFSWEKTANETYKVYQKLVQ